MKCKMVVALHPTLKTNHRTECPFHFRMVTWKSSFSGLTFRIKSLKLRLTPIPTSSTPISNGDLFHPRKMFRSGYVPVFPHNQSERGLAWQVTQRIRNIHPEIQRQTDPDPPKVHESGITRRPIPLFEVPLPDIVGPLQKVGWRKFEYPSQPYPVLTTAIPHRRQTLGGVSVLLE